MRKMKDQFQNWVSFFNLAAIIVGGTMYIANQDKDRQLLAQQLNAVQASFVEFKADTNLRFDKFEDKIEHIISRHYE